MKYRNIGYQQAQQSWKDFGGQIIDARRELQEHYSEMDQYTRNHIQYQINQMKEAHLPSIIGGMLEEFNGAITRYQAAQNKMVEARQTEARSWDAGKLAAELNVSTALIGMALKTKPDSFGSGPSAGQRLEAIWRDAVLSQDKNKIRAVAEVFQSIQDASLDHDTNLAANTIARRAASKLEELRNQTPEIQAASAGIGEARKWLAEVYNAERQGMIDLGEDDPLGMFAMGDMARAYRRVKLDRQTGDINILPEDDPEVLGYSLEVKVKGEVTNGEENQL